jgi:hypothetical protein
MTHVCEVCKFSSKLKSDYIRHLDSKKHKERIKNMKHECHEGNIVSDCDIKKFMLVMQTEISSLKKEIHYLKNENKELKICIEILKKGQVPTTLNDASVNCNNYNDNRTIHYHISLNKYGRESYPDDIKALSDAVKGVNKAIPNLVKLRHFDNRHPENQNIMIPNKKQNKIKIYDGTKWITEDKRLTIEDKLQEFTNFMDTDEGQEIYNGCSLMIREKLDRLMNFCDKVHSGDKLNREEQRELRRITGDVENIILDHQKKNTEHTGT